MTQDQYPFDPTRYDRGDLVPAEDIERAFGVSRDDKEYWRAQMAFRQHLAAHFGNVVPIKSVGAGLYILPPNQESVDYFHNDMQKVRRRIARRLAETTSVDPDQVSAEEMKRLSDEVSRQSWLLQRMNNKRWMPPPPKALPDGDAGEADEE